LYVLNNLQAEAARANRSSATPEPDTVTGKAADAVDFADEPTLPDDEREREEEEARYKPAAPLPPPM
jgi:hypothetical protein